MELFLVYFFVVYFYLIRSTQWEKVETLEVCDVRVKFRRQRTDRPVSQAYEHVVIYGYSNSCICLTAVFDVLWCFER